ncbi:MAG: hypothetical protein NQU45_04965 [Methanothermobacter sp.]|nr:hypothetical protein [Methanothermobacter sp.]
MIIILLVILLVLLILFISPYTMIITGTKKGREMDLELQIILWRFGIFRNKFKGAAEGKGDKFEFKRLIDLSGRALMARGILWILQREHYIPLTFRDWTSVLMLARMTLQGLQRSGYLWAISASTAGLRGVEIVARPDFSCEDVNGAPELRLSH